MMFIQIMHALYGLGMSLVCARARVRACVLAYLQCFLYVSVTVYVYLSKGACVMSLCVFICTCIYTHACMWAVCSLLSVREHACVLTFLCVRTHVCVCVCVVYPGLPPGVAES